MCACPSDSLSSSSWQASFPNAVRNLRGALQLVTNTSVVCHQQAPKKLTTEAVYMIFVLLAFVILTLIGSSIDIYEYLRRAPTRKKLSGGLQKKTSTISNDEKKLSETTGRFPYYFDVEWYDPFYDLECGCRLSGICPCSVKQEVPLS
ncbi:hypothetical protein AVEN_260950-1 [Araneus ventricosus]|uniref:Uncharacterized protein n=1 Tax=Araneus ventricosus TaxID=182803 RepID=A0A4Y2KGG5_ARAVE|nr:hypothetical protein AVEN_260950-1 [Araneus ventricosus]